MKLTTNVQRWGIAIISLILFGLALHSATVNAIQDWIQIAAPANPTAGASRLYFDSSTHKLACVNSDGSSCAPSGGGGGGTVTAPYLTLGTVTAGITGTLTPPGVLSNYTKSFPSYTDCANGASNGALTFAEGTISCTSAYYTPSALSTPWRYTATWQVAAAQSNINENIGVVCRQSSSGQTVTWTMQGNGQVVANALNPDGSYNSTLAAVSGWSGYVTGTIIFAIRDDGTTRYYQISGDGGLTYLTITTDPDTRFCTCDQGGWIISRTDTGIVGTLLQAKAQ